MKKMGDENPKSEEIKKEEASVSSSSSASNTPEEFNYEAEQAKVQEALDAMPPSMVDSIENDNAINLQDTEENEKPKFSDPEEVRGNQNFPPEFYEKQSDFQPAVEVTTKRTGFTAQEKVSQLEKLSKPEFTALSEELKTKHFEQELAKPATEQDLRNLDESMIMNLPAIKADSFKIIDMLNPRPKDPTIRFKWANYKNAVSSNYARYMALGFEVAELSDVDQTKTPIDPSMIDGTRIKYYDVILLKCNVLKLMGLYKSNIIRSVMKLGRIREKGIAEANRQFAADISSTPGATTAYNKIKAGLNGREPVEFFTPGLEESQVVGR